MSETYDRIVDELRYRARHGVPLPHRPEGPALWEAAGCDAYTALLIALEYDAAVREVEHEIAATRARSRRTLADVAA